MRTILHESDPATRARVETLLAQGARVVLRAGELLGVRFEAAEVAELPAVAPPKSPALTKLEICMKCDQFVTGRNACRLIVRDGAPCWAELARRQQTGGTCPHPAGDQWRT